MKIRELLSEFELESLDLSEASLELEWRPTDADRIAAWELYIQVTTRFTVEAPANYKADMTALQNISELFFLTREVLTRNGPGCAFLARIAIPMLNKNVRPFAVRWHKKIVGAADSSEELPLEFHAELFKVQSSLRSYVILLAHMVGLEDLTDFTNLAFDFE